MSSASSRVLAPAGRRLLLASSAALLLELVMVRWIAREAPVLAYFKSFPLLAAFLGMGVGARLARSRIDLAPVAPVALALLAVALCHSESIGLTTLGTIDPNFGGWRAQTGQEVQAAVARGIALLVLMAAGFISLGQTVGRLLDEAGERLAAYGLDLMGGLRPTRISTTSSAAASSRRRSRPSCCSDDEDGMKIVSFVVSALLLFAVPGCRSPSPAAPRGESLVQPLGLEEVSIVSKGLE